jgi:F-type H+-transporting ATPase subunit alpha
VPEPALGRIVQDVVAGLRRAIAEHRAAPVAEEVGTVEHLGQGVARVSGLAGVRAQELLDVGGVMGLAFNLDPDEVGVVLLDAGQGLRAGARVRRTGRVVDVPVGQGLLGRVLDPLGRPLDELGPVPAALRLAIERDAPAILDRSPVTVPLQTGIKVIDALIPIGRGQRELILGDRQTGKTALAVDAVLNQHDSGVLCVYCAVGQRRSSVGQVIAELRRRGAMAYTLVVMAAADDPPGLQFITPYAATAMAEHFMWRGRAVLLVYDDLTQHARAYRQLSLLLRRPPGREAFPGDVFYIHSRLLERSTQLRPEHGGGSLTALPIVETEAGNIAAYIPTNLISITDGQIYLSPELFQRGVLPAVDVGRSVSRVGGKAQRPAYRTVAGDLRLAYAQFEELEVFARFGTRLDQATRDTLERGRRVREVLKQSQFDAMSAAEQIAVLLAATRGYLDRLPPDQVPGAEGTLRQALRAAPELGAALDAVEVAPGPAQIQALLALLERVLAGLPAGA